MRVCVTFTPTRFYTGLCTTRAVTGRVEPGAASTGFPRPANVLSHEHIQLILLFIDSVRSALARLSLAILCSYLHVTAQHQYPSLHRLIEAIRTATEHQLILTVACKKASWMLSVGSLVSVEPINRTLNNDLMEMS